MKAERSSLPIKMTKTGYVLLSAALCALGIVLMAAPDVSLVVFERALGICMVLYGSIKLAGYFSKDLFRLAFQFDLAFGILLLALGVIALARPEFTISFLCVMLGIPLLADALFKVQIAIDAKRFGILRWWLILALAILSGSFGVLLVLRPIQSARAMMVLAGLSVLAEGLMNLCVALCTIKIIKHQWPDELDADERIDFGDIHIKKE